MKCFTDATAALDGEGVGGGGETVLCAAGTIALKDSTRWMEVEAHAQLTINAWDCILRGHRVITVWKCGSGTRWRETNKVKQLNNKQ